MAILRSTIERMLPKLLAQQREQVQPVEPEAPVQSEQRAARPEMPKVPPVKAPEAKAPYRGPLPIRQHMAKEGTSIPTEIRSQRRVEPTPSEQEMMELRQRL